MANIPIIATAIIGKPVWEGCKDEPNIGLGGLLMGGTDWDESWREYFWLRGSMRVGVKEVGQGGFWLDLECT